MGCSQSAELQQSHQRCLTMAVRRDSDNTDGQLFNTQKLALVDLYWSTNGPSWTAGAADHWVVNEEPPELPVCDSTWAGITCAGDDVV